eukprot:CAMPEP_0118928592 /NCGR_PEP_ID=MMETSP1169-20130426/5818_1 /TAXON_ID=36882 /ORGANISM="Pyramimonas obovata, Strain CCMP722" /LENGTH=444 /DNA_ID=CAMNT_0006870619 /DNA_START=555 /DNA_END=1889 /DNA_ORIENTATION=-
MGEMSSDEEVAKQFRCRNPLKLLGRLLAQLLQAMVLTLERAIEWLGHEPERKWENVKLLEAIQIRTPSPIVLAQRAKVLVEKGDEEGALRLYVKCLELEPENTMYLDSAAEILAELGDDVGAKDLVVKSIEIAPNQGHGKYLLLGHLERGDTAITSFEKCLDVLNIELAQLNVPGTLLDKEVASEKTKIKKIMSEVMAAIAKVYLTDCFMEKDAQKICQELLDQSLLYDPDNPESTQALADLRMSQNRKGEALVMVRRTMDICANLDGGLSPSYDFRCVTARLLMELSQYEHAEGVLEDLVMEDEEDTEVWYLLGLCYLLLHKPNKCRTALSQAKYLLERTRTSNTHLMEQINCLLERRCITEEEKKTFWNPRWWIHSDGTASSQSGSRAESEVSSQVSGLTQKSQFESISETSVFLSSQPSGFIRTTPIPEEPQEVIKLPLPV